MALYRFTPLDTLFFRSGRPFGAGEESWADTFFSPAPSNFYGALATWYMAEKNNEIEPLEIIEKLRLKGVFWEAEGDLYLPVPFDLYQDKSDGAEGKATVYPSRTQEVADLALLGNFPVRFKWAILPDYEMINVAKESQGFMGELSFLSYLQGKGISYTSLRPSKFYFNEQKTGIKRDRVSFSAQEHMLYQVELKRFVWEKKASGVDRWVKVSFLVDAEGLDDLPARGTVRLGGEGKIARVEKIDREMKLKKFQWKEPLPKKGGRYFKLVFLTPVIWKKKGWLPCWIEEESMTGSYNGIELKLLCCSCGKALALGGWDMKEKEPKPMYKVIPAGAVYFFEILNDASWEKITSEFHYQNVSEERSNQGFGLAAVGVVN